MPLKVREIIKLLEKEGWRKVRADGSHRMFRGPDGRLTVVSGQMGDDVKQGTFKAILRQTGIKEPK